MYRFLIIFSTCLLIISCNSDDENTVQQEANLYALTVGNTWEYEVYRYNSQNEEYELKDLLITTQISGTSVVNGETYYDFNTTATGTYNCELCEIHLDLVSVRDSIGFLVNQEGTIAFSSTNEEDYLIEEQPWGDIYGVLTPNNVEISTPAGDFTALQNERYVILESGTQSIGRDSKLVAEGAGFVYSTIALVSYPIPLYEFRLKSYTIVED